jgi:hypothetical protein
VDIEYRQHGSKWIVEVWSNDINDHFAGEFKEPYPEDTYLQINDWCKENFGYHARTAYHIFELKNKKDLNWFLLRWV